MTIGPAGGGRRQNAPPGPVLHPRIISSSNPESSTLTTIEPRHPRRFENRKNISGSPRCSLASRALCIVRDTRPDVGPTQSRPHPAGTEVPAANRDSASVMACSCWPSMDLRRAAFVPRLTLPALVAGAAP